MNWQDLAALAVVFCATAYLLRIILRALFPRTGSGCGGGCGSGCSAREPELVSLQLPGPDLKSRRKASP